MSHSELQNILKPKHFRMWRNENIEYIPGGFKIPAIVKRH